MNSKQRRKLKRRNELEYRKIMLDYLLFGQSFYSLKTRNGMPLVIHIPLERVRHDRNNT